MSRDPLTKLAIDDALKLLKGMRIEIQEILDKDQYPDQSPIHWYQNFTNFLKNTYPFREEQDFIAQLVAAQKSTPGSTLRIHLNTLLNFMKTIERDLKQKEQIEQGELWQLRVQNMDYEEKDKALRNDITKLREELHKVRQQVLVKDGEIKLVETSKERTIKELKNDLATEQRKKSEPNVTKLTVYGSWGILCTVINIDARKYFEFNWTVFGVIELTVILASLYIYQKDGMKSWVNNLILLLIAMLALILSIIGNKS